MQIVKKKLREEKGEEENGYVSVRSVLTSNSSMKFFHGEPFYPLLTKRPIVD